MLALAKQPETASNPAERLAKELLEMASLTDDAKRKSKMERFQSLTEKLEATADTHSISQLLQAILKRVVEFMPSAASTSAPTTKSARKSKSKRKAQKKASEQRKKMAGVECDVLAEPDTSKPVEPEHKDDLPSDEQLAQLAKTLGLNMAVRKDDGTLQQM